MKKSVGKMLKAAGTLGIGAGAMWISSSALAQTQYVYADVLDSRPIYQSVTVSAPREECWQEQVRVKDSHRSGSRTPALISAIVGGALGNAVGNNSSSRKVGTVVGAVLGHSVGRDIVAANSRHEPARYQTVQQCELVEEYYDEERLMGYQVRYRYNGEDFSVRMDDDPGERIRLRVQVEPVR
ncbi:MAG: glycine zipper 2TM domain-containing protein [Pseudohongiella sp.]|uniref:glycine zipper 2TM domain-containing protein n=1 Tax=Pseudohongiella sp. TaxID=1979412 RepID=UPI00349FD25B